MSLTWDQSCGHRYLIIILRNKSETDNIYLWYLFYFLEPWITYQISILTEPIINAKFLVISNIFKVHTYWGDFINSK